MFSSTDITNQQTPLQTPEHSRPKFRSDSGSQRFPWRKIPVVAQISGLLSLLLLGAGLLTVNQLTRTTQNLQSQAATGDVLLEFNQPTAELTPGQEKSFFIVATPSNSTMKISAAIIRLRNEDFDVAEVTSISPVAGILPVVLKPLAEEVKNQSLVQHAITLGADPTKPVTGKQNLVEVKVKAKNKVGKANIEIAQNSEIAAFENAGNVIKTYDLANAQKQFLVIDVKDQANPPGTICWNFVTEDAGQTYWPNGCKGTVPTEDLVCTTAIIPLTVAEKEQYNAWKAQGSVIPDACKTTNPPTDSGACVSKTATKVVGVEKTPLQANAKVKPGDTIEYTITVGAKSNTTDVSIDDRFPTAFLEYVGGSAKLDGVVTPINGDEIKKNILKLEYSVGEAGRGKQNKLTYQVKVKPGTEGGEFSNHAAIVLNKDNTTSDSCEFNLGVESAAAITPKLSVKMQIQGVLTAGVTQTGDLSIRYTDPQDSSRKIVRTYPATFTSGANGIFTSNMVELTGLPATSVGSIEVFVKTPTTLRKKLGATERTAFSSTTGELTIDKSQEVLFVGDFDRTQGQENFFRILDVSAMLSQYEEVTNPVTDANREYDLDHNGVINLLDVTIILSNYTLTSVSGDTL